MSAARPLLSRVLLIAELAAVSPQVSFPGRSTLLTVPMQVRSLTSHSHPVPIWTDIYGEEEFEVIKYPAPPEATPSAGTPYSVHLVPCCLLPEAEDVESFMSEIPSACFLLNRSALKTVLDLAKMSLEWLNEIHGQERTFQVRHTIPKPEVGEVV